MLGFDPNYIPPAVQELCDELNAEAYRLSEMLWDVVGKDGHNYGAVNAEAVHVATVDPEHEHGKSTYMEGGY